MDTVLPLLVAGARDLPDRQQTMQRAIAWSYALLDSGDQSFLRHLAIFAGGWTIDAAASLSGLDETALLERLQSLVEKNLVRAEPGEDEPRFHMLQTIREYALGEWDPDALLAVRDRHADYFVQVAARLEPAWRVQQGLDAVREMEREHDNLRAALRWLVERRDTARASELVWLLWRFWWNRNHYTEGERWAEAVLGVLDATTPDRDRGRLLLVSSIMVYAQGFYSRAGARADEALCALRRTGDRWALATALHMRAWIALSWTEPLDADALLLEALDLYRDLDESWGIASVLGLLGGRALAGGDRGLARARYAEAAKVFSAHGSHRSQAYWQTQSALVELLDGRVLEAERLLLHSLSVIGTRVPSASVACLEGLAAVAARKGCSARAATLFGAIHAARAALSYAPMLPVTRDVFDSFLASARTHTSEQTWTSAWAAGLDMSLEEAVRFAESETE
jgi:hypothetical protein